MRRKAPRVREIGEQLNRLGGYEAMSGIANGVAEVFERTDQHLYACFMHELNWAWNRFRRLAGLIDRTTLMPRHMAGLLTHEFLFTAAEGGRKRPCVVLLESAKEGVRLT